MSDEQYQNNDLQWQPVSVQAVFSSLNSEAEVRREIADFERELPAILGRYERDGEAVNRNLQQITELLKVTEKTSDQMDNRNWFQQQWAKLTGQERTEKADIQRNLSIVQSKGICVMDRLMERQEYFQRATQYLGSRIELISMENLKLKAVLLQFGQRVMSRIEALEERVTTVERQVRLLEYFQSSFSPLFRMPYQEIDDPVRRLLIICRDFIQLTEGRWRAVDIHRLEKITLSESFPNNGVTWTLGDLALRVFDALKSDGGDLLQWVKNGQLYDLLMQPVTDPNQDVKGLRLLYPLHFLFTRPYYMLVDQDIDLTPEQIFKQLIRVELDPENSISLNKLMRILLEERLAWDFEKVPLDESESSKLTVTNRKHQSKTSGKKAETDSGQRFVDNDDGTVTDTRTGLMWAKKCSFGELGGVTWDRANVYVGGLGTGGYGDWRMPFIHELMSLFSSGDQFLSNDSSPRPAYYWSSEKDSEYLAYAIRCSDGYTGKYHCTYKGSYGVRAVRKG